MGQHGLQSALASDFLHICSAPAYPNPTVDEIEYGRASGDTLRDAKERAAGMAFRTLVSHHSHQHMRFAGLAATQ